MYERQFILKINMRFHIILCFLHCPCYEVLHLDAATHKNREEVKKMKET